MPREVKEKTSRNIKRKKKKKKMMKTKRREQKKDSLPCCQMIYGRKYTRM